MEPIFIGHNDKSFTSAFGVDVATPSKTITTINWLPGNQYGPCAAGATSSITTIGGTTLPLVTMPLSGKLAIGNASNTVSVGLNPTVVIAYNNAAGQSTTQYGSCGPTSVVSYSGAQSALVVNTGSNSVSLVNIGQYNYPSGTVSVGTTPVAAVINSAGTMAYIANYGSGTISEINLSSVQQSRTIAVGAHPTSVTFDSNGNLWVGGQGLLQSINVTNWSISNSFAINGTMTGMSYDASRSVLGGTILRNGSTATALAMPSNTSSTMNASIAYSTSGGVSHSITSLINPSTGSTSSSSVISDTAPYARSTIASRLAFAGQTAFTPPIYQSSAGDIVAVANGDTFTVSALSSGKVLVSGTTPYPIRGIKLTPTMLYLTMPESNSLVSMPLQLP